MLRGRRARNGAQRRGRAVGRAGRGARGWGGGAEEKGGEGPRGGKGRKEEGRGGKGRERGGEEGPRRAGARALAAGRVGSLACAGICSPKLGGHPSRHRDGVPGVSVRRAFQPLALPLCACSQPGGSGAGLAPQLHVPGLPSPKTSLTVGPRAARPRGAFLPYPLVDQPGPLRQSLPPTRPPKKSPFCLRTRR